VQACTRFQGGEPLAASLTPTEIAAAPSDEPLDPVLPLSLKVTELLAYRRCPQVYRFSHDLEIDENLPRRAAVRGKESDAPSAVELGTIVHALLERARFDAPSIDAEIARLVSDEPAERRDALARMLHFVLDGEIGAAVRAAQRVEREWPFALALDGMLVEGVIDLAIQSASGEWSIVDYKSNDLSRTGRLDYLVDHYTPQLELYALALSRAGLGSVSDCALVFLAGPAVHRWRFEPAARDIDAWARSAGRGRRSMSSTSRCARPHRAAELAARRRTRAHLGSTDLASACMAGECCSPPIVHSGGSPCDPDPRVTPVSHWRLPPPSPWVRARGSSTTRPRRTRR
jgi:hypothetical protein